MPRSVSRLPALENSTHKLLSDAATDVARLDEAAARLPNLIPLSVSTLLHEGQSSLGMMGVFVSFRELLSAEMLDEPPPADVDPELTGLIDVDGRAVERVRNGSPVGRTLLNLVSSSTRRSNAGGSAGFAWRDGHQWVGGREPSEALLLAPPPGAEMRRAAVDCADWIDHVDDFQVIGKSAVGFRDLNLLRPVVNTDHLASLFVSLQFMRDGLLQSRILPMSVWIERDRKRFGAELRRSIEDNSLDRWCRFFADGVREVCEWQRVRIAELQNSAKEYIEKMGRRNDAKLRAVTALICTPVFDTEHLAKVADVTHRHGYNVVQNLLGAGVAKQLYRDSSGRVFYEVPDVLRILRQGYPVPPGSDSEVFES